LFGFLVCFGALFLDEPRCSRLRSKGRSQLGLTDIPPGGTMEASSRSNGRVSLSLLSLLGFFGSVEGFGLTPHGLLLQQTTGGGPLCLLSSPPLQTVHLITLSTASVEWCPAKCVFEIESNIEKR